jgi:hypothetical protein
MAEHHHVRKAETAQDFGFLLVHRDERVRRRGAGEFLSQRFVEIERRAAERRLLRGTQSGDRLISSTMRAAPESAFSMGASLSRLCVRAIQITS